jgi:hypothetical protein
MLSPTPRDNASADVSLERRARRRPSAKAGYSRAMPFELADRAGVGPVAVPEIARPELAAFNELLAGDAPSSQAEFYRWIGLGWLVLAATSLAVAALP